MLERELNVMQEIAMCRLVSPSLSVSINGHVYCSPAKDYRFFTDRIS